MEDFVISIRALLILVIDFGFFFCAGLDVNANTHLELLKIERPCIEGILTSRSATVFNFSCIHSKRLAEVDALSCDRCRESCEMASHLTPTLPVEDERSWNSKNGGGHLGRAPYRELMSGSRSRKNVIIIRVWSCDCWNRVSVIPRVDSLNVRRMPCVQKKLESNVEEQF